MIHNDSLAFTNPRSLLLIPFPEYPEVGLRQDS